MAALLDALDGRDDLDLDRVGALGVSLGGYYAPRARAVRAADQGRRRHQRPVQLRRVLGQRPAADARDVRGQVVRGDDDEGRAKAASSTSTASPSGSGSRPRITGRLDRLIPWEQTERAAREAPRGEFVLLEDGNHVCANVPYKTRPLVADWLREQLG